MSHYLVSTAIDGPKHATFYVEAESREAAADKANYADGTPVRFGHDSHGRIEHVVSVDKVEGERRPEWTVIGVYTSTSDLQPFHCEVPAGGPRDAAVRAICEAMNTGVETSYVRSRNLEQMSQKAGVRLASVRPTYRLDPQEKLFEISDFAA